MKVITRRNANGEMQVQYVKGANQQYFRYCLLKNILAGKNQDITLFIDTNQRIAEKPVEEIESYLQEKQIRHTVILTESNPKLFFGFSVPASKKKAWREHKIIFELPGNAFSKELFDIIKCYDISIGFGKSKPFEVLCENYRMDNALVVFNTESFAESLYDSVVCECLRSSFDVEQYIRITENEIAI